MIQITCYTSQQILRCILFWGLLKSSGWNIGELNTVLHPFSVKKELSDFSILVVLIHVKLFDVILVLTRELSHILLWFPQNVFSFCILLRDDNSLFTILKFNENSMHYLFKDYCLLFILNFENLRLSICFWISGVGDLQLKFLLQNFLYFEELFFESKNLFNNWLSIKKI